MVVDIVNQSNHNLPAYATSGSAGMDLKANIDSPIKLNPSERMIIPTGLHIALPEGCAALVMPRSGLAAKFGITVLNAPGLIDSDYSGDIGVILVNLSDQPFLINPGDRIAQLMIIKYEKVVWIEVPELRPTERGGGGFGSTGI